MPNTVVPYSISSWENSNSFLGFCKALIRTCRAIIFRPDDFFRQLARVRDADLKTRIIRALVFALILGYIKLFLDVANMYGLQYWAKYISKDAIFVAPRLNISFLFAATSALKTPFFFLRPVVAFVLSVAAIAIGIKLVLGIDKALTPALLVVCYKSAADIFYCIPLVGGLLAITWSLALLVIGIREFYAVSFLRSVLSSLIMPLIVLFFIVLAIGPSLNKMLLSFYPEAQAQIVKLNDLSAYANASGVVSAAKNYKQELGFYPLHLEALKKYLSGSAVNDLISPDPSSGYTYSYARADDQHFNLTVRPVKPGYSGRFVFYGDETGQIRLDNRQGEIIPDLNAMEKLTEKEFTVRGKS